MKMSKALKDIARWRKRVKDFKKDLRNAEWAGYIHIDGVFHCLDTIEILLKELRAEIGR